MIRWVRWQLPLTSLAAAALSVLDAAALSPSTVDDHSHTEQPTAATWHFHNTTHFRAAFKNLKHKWLTSAHSIRLCTASFAATSAQTIVDQSLLAYRLNALPHLLPLIKTKNGATELTLTVPGDEVWSRKLFVRQEPTGTAISANTVIHFKTDGGKTTPQRYVHTRKMLLEILNTKEINWG